MSDPATQARSVVVERDLPHPPEKVWRALTQPQLIAEWLMRTDFVAPTPDHRFTLSGDWGAVACKVVEVEPHRTLAYTWDAFGLESVVTWTLTPIGTPPGAGTRLRLEQAGFRPDQAQFHQGAEASWPGFLAKLEQVLARLD